MFCSIPSTCSPFTSELSKVRCLVSPYFLYESKRRGVLKNGIANSMQSLTCARDQIILFLCWPDFFFTKPNEERKKTVTRFTKSKSEMRNTRLVGLFFVSFCTASQRRNGKLKYKQINPFQLAYYQKWKTPFQYRITHSSCSCYL